MDPSDNMPLWRSIHGQGPPHPPTCQPQLQPAYPQLRQQLPHYTTGYPDQYQYLSVDAHGQLAFPPGLHITQQQVSATPLASTHYAVPVQQHRYIIQHGLAPQQSLVSGMPAAGIGAGAHVNVAALQGSLPMLLQIASSMGPSAGSGEFSFMLRFMSAIWLHTCECSHEAAYSRDNHNWSYCLMHTMLVTDQATGTLLHAASCKLAHAPESAQRPASVHAAPPCPRIYGYTCR